MKCKVWGGMLRREIYCGPEKAEFERWVLWSKMSPNQLKTKAEIRRSNCWRFGIAQLIANRDILVDFSQLFEVFGRLIA